MDELREVLIRHARRYPAMAPCDGVKLIFQSRFGGGHLIADPAQSLAALRQEYAATPHDPAAPLTEDIGGGMVRVQLAAVDTADYPLEELNRDFVRSAALRQGSRAGFLAGLGVLRQLAREGVFGFSVGALEEYLTSYFAAGCPPVSHSPEYRQAYAPAYRVLRRSVSLPLLVHEAEELARQGRVIVALDGRCAAGKTTLARTLAQSRGWSVAHMDDFFLRPEQRTPARLAEPGGNVDCERFLQEVLLPLRRGEAAVYRPFDCRTGQLKEPAVLSPAPVTLVEGSYACHPALWEHYDLRAFLTVRPETQQARLAAREGEASARTFQTRWIPIEERYFAACRVEENCDFRLRGEPD